MPLVKKEKGELPTNDAKNIIARKPEKFLLFGHTGSGKSKAFTTLPGKKFLYIFDPNTLNTIAGSNVLYREFLPHELSLDVISLKKDKRDKYSLKSPPTTYIEWETDFEERCKQNWFDEEGINWIGFDSLTTFGDIVMDRLLWINGRPGKHPEQDDWTGQMNTIRNVFRQVTAMNIGVFATGHVELVEDKRLHTVEHQVLVTGKLRVKLPLLFSEIYFCKCESNMEKEIYTIQTRPSGRTPLIRCTLKNVAMYEDVTVLPGKPSELQGLGGLLIKSGELTEGEVMKL